VVCLGKGGGERGKRVHEREQRVGRRESERERTCVRAREGGERADAAHARGSKSRSEGHTSKIKKPLQHVAMMELI